ncbi:neurofilament heavy polypeptide isoform X2 [Hyalella azteca]|uniref:Neurofilament heavy polypeptide isoform X2 n=1 Tax=Hyalella azteca TaxID=294128 RepID=A0A979FJ80_HYAAZ|nr:neurofilament heavy polypeptide isoform X2 [Hyalella azteca]
MDESEIEVSEVEERTESESGETEEEKSPELPMLVKKQRASRVNNAHLKIVFGVIKELDERSDPVVFAVLKKLSMPLLKMTGDDLTEYLRRILDLLVKRGSVKVDGESFEEATFTVVNRQRRNNVVCSRAPVKAKAKPTLGAASNRTRKMNFPESNSSSEDSSNDVETESPQAVDLNEDAESTSSDNSHSQTQLTARQRKTGVSNKRNAETPSSFNTQSTKSIKANTKRSANKKPAKFAFKVKPFLGVTAFKGAKSSGKAVKVPIQSENELPSSVESPDSLTKSLSRLAILPDRPAKLTGRAARSARIPSKSPIRPAKLPGRPAKSPGRPAKSPGRPAKSPGRPAKSPGRPARAAKLRKITVPIEALPLLPSVENKLPKNVKVTAKKKTTEVMPADVETVTSLKIKAGQKGAPKTRGRKPKTTA